MNVILDEGLPMGAAQLLRQLGVDALHVLELGMGGSSDQAVLSKALGQGAAVVTLDADFHQILASTGADRPSVIRVRIEGLKAKELAGILVAVIEQTRSELQHGAVISVGAKRLRLRKLPIKRQ